MDEDDHNLLDLILNKNNQLKEKRTIFFLFWPAVSNKPNV